MKKTAVAVAITLLATTLAGCYSAAASTVDYTIREVEAQVESSIRNAYEEIPREYRSGASRARQQQGIRKLEIVDLGADDLFYTLTSASGIEAVEDAMDSDSWSLVSKIPQAAVATYQYSFYVEADTRAFDEYAGGPCVRFTVYDDAYILMEVSDEGMESIPFFPGSLRMSFRIAEDAAILLNDPDQLVG